MEWSYDDSLRLVDEYRQHPVLWDTRHQKYFSKSRKQEAWEEIGTAMGVEVQEARQKMNSLLGSFRREKSRMRRNREGISGASYCPKWFAFERMQFLLRDDEADVMKYEEEEESTYGELKYSIQEHLEVGEDEKIASVSPPKKMKTMEKLQPDPLLDDYSIFPPQDEYSAFGQYIACKLRKFDPRCRAFIEHSINNVFFEAELGKFDKKPSPFDTNGQDSEANTSEINQVSANLASDSSSLDNVANSS